jgi:hypothetical protein
VRRRSIDAWENDAMERAEALRQSLHELMDLGRAVAEGSLHVEAFFESIGAQTAKAMEVADWLPRWRHGAQAKVSPQAEPSYAVLLNALPLLADSTELFGHSVGVLAISPDPFELRVGDTETDGAVAADGLRLSHDVATAALAVIDETPSLKRKDGRIAQAVLALQRQAVPMVMVLPFVRQRLQTLAAIQGLRPWFDSRKGATQRDDAALGCVGAGPRGQHPRASLDERVAAY